MFVFIIYDLFMKGKEKVLEKGFSKCVGMILQKALSVTKRKVLV